VAELISHDAGVMRRSAEPQIAHGSNRRLARRGGFSLIELMVALGILAFGILATTASQIGSMKVSKESRNRAVAMNLAEEQMEIFEVMPPADILALVTGPGFLPDGNNPIDPDPGDGATMRFARSWEILTDTPEAGVMTITIAVAWLDGLGQTRTTQIQALKVDP
jgi:prepilin-type N-terminal cleavage/methylation domain-containing protein